MFLIIAFPQYMNHLLCFKGKLLPCSNTDTKKTLLHRLQEGNLMMCDVNAAVEFELFRACFTLGAYLKVSCVT